MDHVDDSSELKQLLAIGKSRGYLTYSEINDHLPDEIVETDQVESIVTMITDMGISVVDAPPETDELLCHQPDRNRTDRRDKGVQDCTSRQAPLDVREHRVVE